MNTAVRTPKGTPMRIAPKVPQIELRIMGRMPNWGSAAVGAQVVPSKNSLNPICVIAGVPDAII